MRFVYAVINLLILAGLIYLVGRKSIVKIFRSRREKITRELDEAETPFAPEPLPEMPAPDDTALKSDSVLSLHGAQVRACRGGKGRKGRSCRARYAV